MVSAVIWVEGKADQKFFSDILNLWFDLHFNNKDFKCRDEEKKVDISIQDLGGKMTFLTPKISSLLKGNVTQGVNNIIIIDADDIEEQRRHLEKIKVELQIDFPYYLLPDNNNKGELEDLLEQIINPDNKSIFDCWRAYELCVSKFDNPARSGHKYTIPAKKSKIYSYMEVLLGETESEKELAKDRNRDFTNSLHWQIDNKREPLKSLYEFLKMHLSM